MIIKKISKSKKLLFLFAILLSFVSLTSCFGQSGISKDLDSEISKLELAYNAYVEEPSAEAVQIYKKYKNEFSDTDHLQIKRTAPLLEFKLRKNLDANKLKSAAKEYPNPFAGESIPFYLQYDQRWAFEKYAGGLFGETGCGPTVLTMIYQSLTGDNKMTPKEMGEFSSENGFAVDGSGSKWTLMSEGAEKLGLHAKELPLWKDTMVNELVAGHPIILVVGAGDFTSTGHFVILRDYTEGAFSLYDPFSLAHSQKKWTYEQLEGQIKNIWSYSLE